MPTASLITELRAGKEQVGKLEEDVRSCRNYKHVLFSLGCHSSKADKQQTCCILLWLTQWTQPQGLFRWCLYRSTNDLSGCITMQSLFTKHGARRCGAREPYWLICSSPTVAMPSSRGSSQPRDWTWVSYTTGGLFTIWFKIKLESEHLSTHSRSPEEKARSEFALSWELSGKRNSCPPANLLPLCVTQCPRYLFVRYYKPCKLSPSPNRKAYRRVDWTWVSEQRRPDFNISPTFPLQCKLLGLSDLQFLHL